MAKKKYKANIYFVGDIDIIVTANNQRQAFSIAKKRVSARKIGLKSIRSDFSDIERIDNAYS
jgi:hypothetical protein